MNKRLLTTIATTVLILITALTLYGCGSTHPGEGAPEKKVKNYGSGVVISDIKKEYSVDRTSEKNQMKPFWNVDPKASFVIHFNSRVEPLLAVTVHTEPTCRDSSRVGVMTNLFVPKEGNGVYVVVSPRQAVLETDDENLEVGESWGYAPVYYLCIHYDRFSEDVQKLDTPVFIPFTVAADVSTPTVSSMILPDGQYALKWKPVKDAVSYEIYKCNVVSLVSDDMKEYLNNVTRADVGYSGDVPKKLATVSADTTSFTDFYADDEFWQKDCVKGTTLSKYNDGSINNENGFLGDVFYVRAVTEDGGRSNFSMAQEKWKYDSQLPKNIDNLIYRLESFDFPETIDVEMVDGSVRTFPVDFKLKEINEYGIPYYEYRPRGTGLSGICEVDYDLKDLDWPEEHKSSMALNSGIYKITNPINIVPEIDASTVTDSSGKPILTDTSQEYAPRNCELWSYPEKTRMNIIDMDLATLFSSGVPIDTSPEDIIEQFGSIYDEHELVGETGDEEPADENFIDEQQATTDQDIEQADQWEVPDTPYPVFADSAEEEYLARMMIEGEEQIDISAFPRMQDTTFLWDTLEKVVFQNPYILDVSEYSYNSDYHILYVTYDTKASKIKKKQKQIKEECEEIVGDCITSDMSDEEKIMALWTALEESTEYDHEACDALEESDYESVPPEYADAYNAYGIICKKLGVCQSYALSYKLLLEEAGVDSVVLTGFADLTLPHAWNAVQIDGSWYWMDVTNNYHNTGVEYLLYEASSDDALQQKYVLDDLYDMNNNLGFVENHDNSRNYYYRNDMVAFSPEDIPDAAANAYKNRKENIFAVKMATESDSASISQGILSETAKKLQDSGASDEEVDHLQYTTFQNYLVFIVR